MGRYFSSTWRRYFTIPRQRFILVVFLATVLVRSIFLLSALDIPAMGYFNFHQNLQFVPDSYDQIAKNLLDGHGFSKTPGDPYFGKGPIYPLFISVIFLLSGSSILALRLSLYLIAGITAVLVYLLGEKIFSARVGRLAAMLYACYLPEAYLLHKLWPEPIITLLMLLSVLFTLQLSPQRPLKTGVTAGFAYGLGILTKQTFLFIPLFLPALFLLVTKGDWQGKIKTYVATNLIAFIIMSPWTYRNFAASDGYFIPVHTYGGSVAMVGDACFENIDIYLQGGSVLTEFVRISHERELKIIRAAGFANLDGQNPAQDALLRDAAFARYKADPTYLLEKMMFFVPKFWYFGGNLRLSRLSLISHLPIYLFFILGIFQMGRERQRRVPFIIMISLIMYFNLIHSMFWVVVRYAMPIMPLVLLIASPPLVQLYDGLRNRLALNTR